MSYKLVIAEKPSVAQSIAKVIGADKREDGYLEGNPAIDATVPKAKKEVREIWTAEMLMQALEACDNKMLKIAFHLAFTATLRIGELLGLHIPQKQSTRSA